MPALPMDEAARLLSLHKLQILDTRSEERFDRITNIVQRIFGTNICLVSLVDANRQWFKSRQGLDAAETPRTVSFCGHTILDDEVFIVSDTSLDPRFADNPLVTGEPNIRFYAGCPIRGPGGYRIGTLCVIDREPRCFSLDDQTMLRDMAALVEDELLTVSQAIVDELTELANRRGFNTVARHLFNLCRRTNSGAELMLFDLNGLKLVNDNHGHDAGDALLGCFADLLVKSFPAADVVARMGGDEFAVLTFAMDSDTECALRRLEQLAADSQTATEHPFSWSVGCAKFDAQRHLNIESLLKEADSLMYENKAEQRAASTV